MIYGLAEILIEDTRLMHLSMEGCLFKSTNSMVFIKDLIDVSPILTSFTWSNEYNFIFKYNYVHSLEEEELEPIVTCCGPFIPNVMVKTD